VLSSGHLLDNRYRLDERIATGGMGDVWRGTDVVLGRVIAVKVLRPAMLADPEFAARFYGEARMMAAFRHPGVVEVYDYANAGDSANGDGCAYLVMAYVDGEPLSTRLKEAGRLGVTETMSIVSQTADALHAAHEHGTVHRDVKPGNLIVKSNGTVILVDFGVARSNAVTSMTGLNAIVGTALYMAPEQVAKGNVTAATDIYALGAVAYHCIAGRPPFDGDNALQVALRHLEDEPDPLPVEVPEPVRALISRAMAKRPTDRFDSAAEFADAALAASRQLDWRTLAGTSVTAPLSPAQLGPAHLGPAHLGPAQLSPAAPAWAVPVPGDLPLSSPPRRRTGTPRGQLAVQLAVLALFVVAVGLAVAIWVNSSDNTAPGDNPAGGPTATSTSTGQPNQQLIPTLNPATRATIRPNGTIPKPSLTKPSAAGTPSATASTKPAAPATTAPTTATTTAAPAATTAPADTPTTAAGAGAGAGPGTGS
jgi:serine/threonine protein kinase